PAAQIMVRGDPRLPTPEVDADAGERSVVTEEPPCLDVAGAGEATDAEPLDLDAGEERAATLAGDRAPDLDVWPEPEREVNEARWRRLDGQPDRTVRLESLEHRAAVRERLDRVLAEHDRAGGDGARDESAALRRSQVRAVVLVS